jgi:hypothetical protein
MKKIKRKKSSTLTDQDTSQGGSDNLLSNSSPLDAFKELKGVTRDFEVVVDEINRYNPNRFTLDIRSLRFWQLILSDVLAKQKKLIELLEKKK